MDSLSEKLGILPWWKNSEPKGEQVMFETELKNLGLSEKEAKVYLASLELGPETMLKISRFTGINRPTVYVQVESLIKKGLMSSFIKGKKRYFSAEPPERLLSLVEAVKRDFEKKEKSFEKILPELKSIFNLSGERPRVRFYEGKEGIKAIQEDIFKSKFQSLEEFTNLDEAYKLFPPHPRDHRQVLLKKHKNIPRRIIYTSEKGAILPPKEGPRLRRFIPKEKFPFSGEISIYGDKIALISLGKKIIGCIIESQLIAQTLRTIFDLAWEAAKKYQK